MKSYLNLIPISAKVHKRQNRLTLLCIIFAVFLVTAVFSMAEMSVRMEAARLVAKHGSQTFLKMISSSAAKNYFMLAGVLFILILIAGVLMISSSINSNVAQRTKFFGMMRCIGMSKRQIINFVRLEALNWCKTAIPIGVALGVVTTWALCAVLRFIVGEEFSDIPLFGISLIGIIIGILVGIITVLIAANSPAKRAAKVSPVAAISGNYENTKNKNHAFYASFLKIETTLGIQHAVSNKKNLIMMTGSFALSIILFLSFYVIIEFVGYIMPQSSNTADLNISSSDGLNSIDSALLNKLKNMDGVKRVFARRDLLNIPAKVEKNDSPSEAIDLISYDDFDLDSLTKDKMLKHGSDINKVYGNSNYALAIGSKNHPLKTGDSVQVTGQSLTIAGTLKYDPFSNNGSSDGITLITSDQTFTQLTGITDYSLVMIQTTKKATNENVAAIYNLLNKNYKFSDQRSQSTANTYIAFVFFVYAFLIIIALVTVLNIINSISMSVSAKIKQYGAMRAVGMSGHQMAKMIAAEAFTYAISGCIFGCAIGLLISKSLYDYLITTRYDYASWNIPIIPLVIIILSVLATTIVAVYAPAKRIKNMAITDTINEL